MIQHSEDPLMLMRALALVCLGISTAHAATVTANWSAPTMCTDGSPVSGCTVTKYTLYSGLAGQPKTVIAVTDPTVLTFSALNTGPGNWCLQVSASSSSGEGPLSGESCIVVAAPAPGTPGAPTLTLTVGATMAYMELRQPDGFAFLQVGTVPLGTPCDVTQRVNAFNVVPRSAVTFSGSIKPLAVLAACQ